MHEPPKIANLKNVLYFERKINRIGMISAYFKR